MLIGIGGLSRSGKSTLASQIRQAFEEQGKSCQILAQDDFVKEESLIPKIRDRVDWEHPDSIDWETLIEAVKLSQESFEITIMEGLMAFAHPLLTSMYDHKIYLHISKSTFLARKAADERWGPEPAWFIEHIWESFHIYGKIDAGDASFQVFSGEKEIDISDMLSQWI